MGKNPECNIKKEINYEQGIGKELLSYCKNKYDKLTLEVYKKNTKAINFYEREQFKPIKEDVDEANNEVEILMEWKKN